MKISILLSSRNAQVSAWTCADGVYMAIAASDPAGTWAASAVPASVDTASPVYLKMFLRR